MELEEGVGGVRVDEKLGGIDGRNLWWEKELMNDILRQL